MPHIEERRMKRGKGEEKGVEKRKPQKKKFPAGRKSVVKQKKDSNISRDSGKAACRARKRIVFVSSARSAIQEKKRNRRTVRRWGWKGIVFSRADHDSFNVKLEHVTQHDGNFYSPCLPGN